MYELAIVGMGPAGLGLATTLAEIGRWHGKVVCLEEGRQATSRFCSISEGKGCRHAAPCEITGGIGGASVVSGGKISAFPAGGGLSQQLGAKREPSDALREALREFERHVALETSTPPPERIEAERTHYEAMGFDYRFYDARLCTTQSLVEGYQRMLEIISRAGFEVKTSTSVERISRSGGAFELTTHGLSGVTTISAKRVALCTGRSGTSLLAASQESLGLKLVDNPPDVGVRLEFPMRLLPNLTKVHRDLKLHFGTARTFCVCSGGQLAPYRIGKMFVLEGHSDPTHEGKWTNFAVTARLSGDSVWRGEALLKEVSRRVVHESGGLPLRQGLSEYLSGQGRASELESSITYWRWGEIDECFPPDVAATVREAVRFLAERLFATSDWDKVSVYAPELDYYWPFPLAAGFEVGPGLFIAGDASGQYRGILQAFCAGRELAARLGESAC